MKYSDKITNYKLTSEQVSRANELAWYHAIDYGSHQSAGRINPPLPPNMTLFGVMDILEGVNVSGMRCLEVGPAHGLISAGLFLKGAKSVSCIDIGPAMPPQMRLSEEVYGCSFDYHANTPLEKVQEVFESGYFDLVVCAGVMYHLLNPADVFFKLRPLIKPGGFIIIETVCVEGEKKPVLVLNSEEGGFPQPTTYFLASPSAVAGMAKLSCFDVLATRINSPARFSLIGRAVSHDKVKNRTPLCRKMHEYGFEDPAFETFVSNTETDDCSMIVFDGIKGHKRIDVKKHIPNFPTHPKIMNKVVGKNFHVPGLTK